MPKPNLTDLRMLIRAAYWSDRGIPAYLNAGEGAALKRLKTRGLVGTSPHEQEFMITGRGDALLDEMLKLLTPAAIDAMEERNGVDDD